MIWQFSFKLPEDLSECFWPLSNPIPVLVPLIFWPLPPRPHDFWLYLTRFCWIHSATFPFRTAVTISIRVTVNNHTCILYVYRIPEYLNIFYNISFFCYALLLNFSYLNYPVVSDITLTVKSVVWICCAMRELVFS